MADGTYQGFIGDIKKYQSTLAEDGAKAIAQKMGMKAKQLAEQAARSDLGGDPKFSGWTPELGTRFDHLEPGKVGFKPTRMGAGGWTVAERGRNQGNGGGFSGPGVNKKTGATSKTKSGKVAKVKSFKAKKWNGTTKGKGTATDATKLIEAAMPKVVEVELSDLLSKYFP